MAASEKDTLGNLGRLPPEIRNEVYKLCLIAQNPVRIARVVKCKKQYQDGNIVLKHPRPALYGLECTALDKLRWTRQYRNAAEQVVSFGLLYVSKAINLEARSILYGSNRFEFQSAPALGEFFQAYTSHSTLIRNLAVKQVKSTDDPKHLTWLAHSKKPERVSVSIEAVKWRNTTDARGFPDFYRVAEASTLWPLLKPFIRKRISSPDQESGVGPGPPLSAAEQRKRFDALKFHIPRT